MKKFLSLTLALCLMLTILAGCNNATASSTATEVSSSAVVDDTAPTTVSFSWWGGDARHEATMNADKAYVAKFPNVTISEDYGAWTDWETKMSASFYAGTAPDLNQANWNWLYNYDNGGKTFVDLNTMSDYIDLTQFDAAALEQCTVDGRLNGIPIALTGRIFYWNEATFVKAGIEVPKSFADLMAAGEIFKTKLGEEYYPLALGEYDRMIFLVYYLECKYGKNWVENGELQYTAEEITEGLQVLLDMEAAHVIPSIQTIAGDGAESLDKNPKWMDGKYAGIYEWDSSASKFQAAITDGNFVVGDFFSDIGPNKGGFVKVSMCYAISQSAKDPVAAAKLMNYLLNDAEAAEILTTQRGIPGSKAALKVLTDKGLTDAVVADANAKVISWCAYNLDPTFEDAGLKATSGAYYDVMAGVSYGDYTPADGAAALIEGINNVLSQAK